MKTITTVFFTLISLLSYGQTTVSGTIADSETNEPLAYASVRIIESSFGSLSDEAGWFELVIPKEYKKDSIQFSFVGYEPKSFLVKDLTGSTTVLLKPSKLDIDEVVVTPISADSIMMLVRKNYSKNHIRNKTKQSGFMRTKLWESDHLSQIGETAYSVYYTDEDGKTEQEALGLKSRIVIDSAEFKKINEVFHLKRDTLLIDPVGIIGFMQEYSRGDNDKKGTRKTDTEYEYLGRSEFQGREAYNIGLKAKYKGKDFAVGKAVIDFETYAVLSESLETVDDADLFKMTPFALRTVFSILGFDMEIKKLKSSVYYTKNGDVFDLDKGVVFVSLNAARGGDWVHGHLQQEFYLNARKDSDSKPKKNWNLRSEIVENFDSDFFADYFHLPTTEKTLEEIDQISERNHEFSGTIFSSKHEKWLKKQERKNKKKSIKEEVEGEEPNE